MIHKAKTSYIATILAISLVVSARSGFAQQPTPSPTPVLKQPISPVANDTLPAALPSALPQTPGHQTHSQGDRGGVTVQSLVDAAVEANPELVAMRREFDAARARVPQAKALPDPMLMFSNNTVGNPVPFVGLNNDFSEIIVGASQDLPWFGVRRLRGQVASAQAEAKFQEYAATVRRLTADVKTAYYDLYYTERALAVIARDKEILDKIAQVAAARYEVGKAQQVDVINARVEITELVHREGMLEAKREGTIAQLNKLLFREQETPIGVLARLHMAPEPPSFEELMSMAAENAPDLAQQRRLIDASSKAVRLAEKEARYPEVGLNFQYHNRPLFKDYYTYGVTLRIPLYAARKQRYAIAEQSANLATARARLASNESLIQYRLRDARVRTTTTARLIRLHEQGLIPQGTLALESALSAYQVGQSDFPTVLTALRRVLDYELQYYELLTDYQKALAEMEAFVGVELTKG